MRSYRKRLTAALTMLALLGMCGYAMAVALGPETGKTVKQKLTAKVSPKKLPRNKWTPAKLKVRIDTRTEAGAPRPPRMETATVYLDKHAKINTKGLATCPASKLYNTRTPAARKACPDAIVGKGKAMATVAFADQAPIPAPADGVTVFNGVPKRGKPVFLIHAFTTVPAPTTFIVPGVFENYNKKGFGYRLKFKVPAIAGGHGSLVSFKSNIFRTWRHKGKKVSYGYARCPKRKGKLKIRLDFTYSTINEQDLVSGKLNQRKQAVQRCRG